MQKIKKLKDIQNLKHDIKIYFTYPVEIPETAEKKCYDIEIELDFYNFYKNHISYSFNIPDTYRSIDRVLWQIYDKEKYKNPMLAAFHYLYKDLDIKEFIGETPDEEEQTKKFKKLLWGYNSRKEIKVIPLKFTHKNTVYMLKVDLIYMEDINNFIIYNLKFYLKKENSSILRPVFIYDNIGSENLPYFMVKNGLNDLFNYFIFLYNIEPLKNKERNKELKFIINRLFKMYSTRNNIRRDDFAEFNKGNFRKL